MKLIPDEKLNESISNFMLVNKINLKDFEQRKERLAMLLLLNSHKITFFSTRAEIFDMIRMELPKEKVIEIKEKYFEKYSGRLLPKYMRNDGTERSLAEELSRGSKVFTGDFSPITSIAV